VISNFNDWCSLKPKPEEIIILSSPEKGTQISLGAFFFGVELTRT
jgi:hypothetical protein